MTEIPIGIVAILALVGAHILWVLLPLAPAVLIYWLFPNTPVAVSGPLSGLTVRTGGAFGAIWWCCCSLMGSFERSTNRLQCSTANSGT